MNYVSEVKGAYAAEFSSGFDPKLLVGAAGVVNSSGWSNIRLAPRYYIVPPGDGVWDFDFIGDPPSGIVLPVELPVSAWCTYTAPPWLKGVKVHAERNSILVQNLKTVAPMQAPNRPLTWGGPDKTWGGPDKTKAAKAHVIVRQQIASYDDSWQPIGMCSLISVKMKKLHHSLVLVVEGPDEAKIRECINSAAAAGLIAAIIAVYVTGGAGLQAAVSAFLSTLTGCLGGSYSARIDDESHWVEWCT
jgi:hypothetical protein